MNVRSRLVAAFVVAAAALAATSGAAADPHKEHVAHPPHRVLRNADPTYQRGYSPDQIRAAYGFAALACGSTCGSGQTIAIVDAFDDPTVESDLVTFDQQFGLPACTTANGCFTKATPQGVPKTDPGWALEIALDVEWAHAIAPGARILLVEAASSGLADLFAAVDYAVAHGASSVSMSWGTSGEFLGETLFDSHFAASGVSFFASSGDNGAGLSYPAVVPNVTAVGGTTLPLDAGGSLTGSETAWSGSGGGISVYEPRPAFQNGFSSGSGRAVPDVSYVADPATGVAVYDSTPLSGTAGWFLVGGTSAGAPQWAALTAIANGLRSAPLSGANASLYRLGPDFRDITTGSNGSCGAVCTAGPGYDTVTGLGSPLANVLVPALAPAGASGNLSFATAPQSLTAGAASDPIVLRLSSAAAADVGVSLSSSSAAGRFSTSPSGPWSTSLPVTIPAGDQTSPSFYYLDTKAGSPKLTAAAADLAAVSQTETVTAAGLATIVVSPGSATVAVGGTQRFTTTGADAYGNSVAVSPAWSMTPTLGSFSPNAGAATTFTPNATGSGTVTATVGSVAGTASVTVVATRTARVASVTYGTTILAGLLVTVSVVDASGNPVSGASVSVALTRNGAPYSSGTGTTNAAGKTTLVTYFSPAGCYSTTVTKVTATGFAWDGVTPPNQFCK